MKIRTDFVTNSSSSSFTVNIEFNLKNGESLSYTVSNDDYYHQNDDIYITVSPKELGTAKSISKMIEMLKNEIMNVNAYEGRDGEFDTTGMEIIYYFDESRDGREEAVEIVNELEQLNSMDEIESITMSMEEEGMHGGFYSQRYTYYLEEKICETDIDGKEFESEGAGGYLHFDKDKWASDEEDEEDLDFYIDENGICKIPDDVTSIVDGTFSDCEHLKSIDVDKNNAYYASVDGVLYTKDKKKLLWYPAGKDCASFSILEGVTSIVDFAFSRCNKLTSIELPNSVTSVGENAFCYCRKLMSINVDKDNSVYTSVDGVLYTKDKKKVVRYPEAKKGTSYSILDGVTSIEGGAFSRCLKLTSIAIPYGVVNIGAGAFFHCLKFTNIEIPDSVTSIGNGAFSECIRLVSMEIPDNVTSIGDETFSNCDSLTSVKIPNGVTSIGNNAFYHCKNLASIEIPNSTTNIGDKAFYKCYCIKSVKIPYSVRSIGSEAFFYCDRLTDITVDENSAFYTFVDGVLYTKDKKKLVWYWLGKNRTSYSILESVTSIGNYAFSGHGELTSIEIPDSVTSIGDKAFYYCEGLKSIKIPDSVTSIGDEAFYYCKGLKSIKIPDSVTSIGKDIFEGCSLTVIAPKGSYAASYAAKHAVKGPFIRLKKIDEWGAYDEDDDYDDYDEDDDYDYDEDDDYDDYDENDYYDD